MIGHDDPCMKLESFIFDTVIQTIHYNVAIVVSGKSIYPLHDRSGSEIGAIRIVKCICKAHVLNIMFIAGIYIGAHEVKDFVLLIVPSCAYATLGTTCESNRERKRIIYLP
jgi:hypothetical protein